MAVQGPAGAPDPRAVLAAFGLTGEVTSYDDVAGGWSNRVLRLGTTAGDYAVKELRNPWGEPRWREWLAESWRLERAALAAGVDAPEPVPASDGGCVAYVDRTDHSPQVPVRVHRWTTGRTPTADDVDLDLAAWAGRTLATIHGLGLHPRDPSVFPVPSAASVDAWPDLCDRATTAGAPWASALRCTLPAVRRAAEFLSPPGDRETVMVHGDLRLTNVLVTPTGPVLCDWDVALPRVPAWDLADVAVSLAGWSDRRIASTVRRTYGEAGGHLEPPSRHDLAPTIMVRLDFVSLLVHRALGLRPATPAEQDVASDRLPTLLAEIPGHVELAESLEAWLG